MPIRFPCANPECGFELVISARAEAREIRCPNCGLVQPVPDHEPLAPAPRDAPPQPPRRRKLIPIAEPEPPLKERGLVGDGLRSGLYALRALPKMLVVVLALLGARVLYDLYFGPLSVLRWMCCFEIVLPLVMGAWWYAMIGFALRYFLDVSLASLEGYRRTPSIPRLAAGDLFEYGISGLGVLFLYVLPLVTLPLLPLGLLGLAYSDDTRPFDVRWALRAARRFPMTLAKTWAVVLAWCGALAAGAWAISWAAGRWVRYLVDASRGELGMLILASAVDVLGGLVIALIGCIFLCVLFRCVGLMGRYHGEVLQTLPEKPPANLALAGMVAAGVAASMLVHYGLYRLLSWS